MSANNNPIILSKRNIHILITLCYGPITFRELKEICFIKNPQINYKLFKREKDRLRDQKRDQDPYTSRQFVNSKLVKLQKRGLIGAADYFEITNYGMLRPEKIYYLTEMGMHHVCRSFNINKLNVRYGDPLPLHMDHEVNLSRILRKIHYDAKSGHYKVKHAHADRALRSILHRVSHGGSIKGVHFVDLRVGIISQSGNMRELSLELANQKDDPAFWQDKIKSIEEPFFIICKDADFVTAMCQLIRHLRLSYEMYVGSLEDFLNHGFLSTVWQKVTGDEVQAGRIILN